METARSQSEDKTARIGSAIVGTAVVATSASEKLDLAKFNLNKMKSARTAREFAFELSNFLAAARSVSQIMMTEAKATKNKSAGDWIRDSIDASARLSLLRSERDLDIKERLVEVRRVFNVQLDASLSPQASLAIGLAGSEITVSSPAGMSSGPVQNVVSAAAYFPTWQGTEDIVTLCSQMVADLEVMLEAFPEALSKSP